MTFHGPGTDEHDPLPEIDPKPSTTALDALRGLVHTRVARPEVTWHVPTRPGWSVRYSTEIDGDVLAEWGKKATDKNKPGGLNNIRLACLGLGSRCVAILKDGQPIGEGGADLSFRDPGVLDLFGVRSVSECVRRFYGGEEHIGDGELLAHWFDLLREAGFSDDGTRLAGVDDVDPTPRSSTSSASSS